MNRLEKLGLLGVLLQVMLIVFTIVSWVTNLIKFVNCDFDASYKEEIIHGLGVVIAPISLVTAWI